MPAMIDYSARQLRAVRFLIGIYFFYQFVAIYPYRAEFFSDQGWLPSSASLIGFLPNLFWVSERLVWVSACLIALALASLAFAFGFRTKICAVLIWSGIASLVIRNNYYYEHDLCYLGWLVLAFLFFPESRGAGTCRIPRLIWGGAWVILSIGYSWSGLSKCGTVEWMSGGAVAYSLATIVSRLPESAARIPFAVSAVLTWSVLAAETFFAVFALFGRTRPWIWLAMTLIQISIGLSTRLTEFNIAVLIFHLFLFSPAWWEDAFRMRAPGQSES